MEMRMNIKLLCFCLLLFALVVEGYPDFCAYGRANQAVDVKQCDYGWDVDPCGNKVCAKGNLQQ